MYMIRVYIYDFLDASARKGHHRDDCQGDDQEDSSGRETREIEKAERRQGMYSLTPTIASVAVERRSKDKVPPEASPWKSSGPSFRLAHTRIPLRAMHLAMHLALHPALHARRAVSRELGGGGGAHTQHKLSRKCI